MLKLFEWLMPACIRSTSPDARHYHRRRFTRAYKKKQQIVKSLWIGSGILMLLVQALPYMVVSAMFTTCLAFMILDETQ